MITLARTLIRFLSLVPLLVCSLARSARPFLLVPCSRSSPLRQYSPCSFSFARSARPFPSRCFSFFISNIPSLSQNFYPLLIDRSRSYPRSHARPARSRAYPCSRMCHFILNFRLIICPLHLHPSRSYPRSHARLARSRSLATLAPSSFSFSIALCTYIPLARILARMLALLALGRSQRSPLLPFRSRSFAVRFLSLLPLLVCSACSLAPLAPSSFYFRLQNALRG